MGIDGWWLVLGVLLMLVVTVYVWRATRVWSGRARWRRGEEVCWLLVVAVSVTVLAVAWAVAWAVPVVENPAPLESEVSRG